MGGRCKSPSTTLKLGRVYSNDVPCRSCSVVGRKAIVYARLASIACGEMRTARAKIADEKLRLLPRVNIALRNRVSLGTVISGWENNALFGARGPKHFELFGSRTNFHVHQFSEKRRFGCEPRVDLGWWRVTRSFRIMTSDKKSGGWFYPLPFFDWVLIKLIKWKSAIFAQKTVWPFGWWGHVTICLFFYSEAHIYLISLKALCLMRQVAPFTIICILYVTKAQLPHLRQQTLPPASYINSHPAAV